MKRTFVKMGLEEKDLHPSLNPLCGFGGWRLDALGKMELDICFRQGRNARVESITFDVVDYNYPYNAILGRATLNAFEAVVHSAYLAMKIPSCYEVITVFGNQDDARRTEGGWRPGDVQVNAIEEENDVEAQQLQAKGHKSQAEKEKAKAGKYTKCVPLDVNVPEQTLLIGAHLSQQEEERLMQCLRANRDVFAWSDRDLGGIRWNIIEHSLNVNPTVEPKKRNLRNYSEDRAEGARSEVNRLLEEGVIRPIVYPEWVTNVVMVKKPSGKWRMCIDFTDLNKACPKDEFPLLRIDVLVDAAASAEMMSLLDGYSGYHQI
jgi:hypothetical protein